MLNWKDIESFLASSTVIKERVFLECKKATNNLPKDFWKSFSAFSNTQGGFILLGVSENFTRSFSKYSNTF
ncbi:MULTISPECIES: AlbA family DNA-binding domain-containing protein [Pasteurellaceae]|uniref:ATP-binding protein n=1 Tax=Pasteurella atlantica TaxID=2827233 RepID=A0AAW8CDG0_9PAST|nr:ATP-binding protein [Pasteurella atlantica]MBR0572761.1 ATP-binding protein [Pasteurella atlantica]MDP8038689.1 ATP-binding protein [Pasteurella atlantica]MDP8040781.1 ATP-binding protein [Pasteurella atlantica]MDP8043046.1 ATP-binding protein [Pasteurella atlantica]MDP8045132.1 ATP-binding protein [Pasteurella atlantica]